MRKVIAVIAVLFFLPSCASYFENRIDKDVIGDGGMFDAGVQIGMTNIGIRFYGGTFASRPVGAGDKTSFMVEEGIEATDGTASIDKRVTITQDSQAPTTVAPAEDAPGEESE